MRCPACHEPMALARYVPNAFKRFECSRCIRRPRATARKVPGYTGSLILSPKVPLIHQERFGALDTR